MTGDGGPGGWNRGAGRTAKQSLQENLTESKFDAPGCAARHEKKMSRPPPARTVFG
ncbi:hypothetical protein FTUN_1160 [Frigoriglobus tundricola]|uniref:Uncharacterized protein n=1 Tax=Frigoriglobus tundricola TaxID=2774151 RepID=A0A6M5YKX8_9BACT|nr:hypothetical protein FTUN_1160 [Frigoriglobus tundricola]